MTDEVDTPRHGDRADPTPRPPEESFFFAAAEEEDDDEAIEALPLGAAPPRSPSTTAPSSSDPLGKSRSKVHPSKLRRIGHYLLESELGTGGQGSVYLARDTRLDRRVALKVLKRSLVGSPEARLRFEREAAILSALDHPSLCAIYEAGMADGTAFIAMRYVAGTTLAKLISKARESHCDEPAYPELPESSETSVATRTPSSPRGDRRIAAILDVFERTARAIHHAHVSGIVHRDIKPANIMIASAGDPVVLDFGLARSDDGPDDGLTHTGDLIGTPAYMAPEQIRPTAKGIDARADVYALGVCLYEALTLARPFAAPTHVELMRAIVEDSVLPPRRRNPAIPRDLETVVAKAMERDVDRRYATALDFAEDLRRVRQDEPIAARPPGIFRRADLWRRRHPTIAATVLVIALAVCGFIAQQQSALDRLAGEKAAAEAAARRADSNRLAALSENALREDTALAMNLGAEAARLLPTRAAGNAICAALGSHTEEAVLYGHDLSVEWVRWAADGKRVVSADVTGLVIVWDAETRRIVRRVDLRPELPKSLYGFVGASDRVLLATVSGKLVDFRADDVAAPTLREFPNGPVTAIAVDRSCRRLATASASGAVTISSLGDGENTASPALALAPAGVIDAESDRIVQVDLSPDGRRLVCIYDKRPPEVFDTATLRRLFALEVEAGVHGAASRFRSDDQGRFIVLYEFGGRARVYDGANGRCRRIFGDSGDPVFSLDVAADGLRLVLRGFDQRTTAYEPAADRILYELKYDSQHGVGGGLTILPKSGLVVVWSNVDFGMWTLRIDDLSEYGRYAAHKYRVHAVDSSADGERLASASGDGTVRIWRTSGANGRAGWLSLAALGRRHFGRPLPDGESLVVLVEIAGRMVAARADLSTGEIRVRYDEAGETIAQLTVSGEGRFAATAATDGTIRVFEVGSGRLFAKRSGLLEPGIAPKWGNWRGAVADDGSFVCYADKSGVHIAATRVDSPSRPIAVPVGDAARSAISPDSRSIVSADIDRRTATLYDAATGKVTKTLIGHTGYVMDAVFSPDSRSVATTAVDTTIAVWDTATGKLKTRITGLPMHENAVSWSRDGAALGIAVANLEYRIFDISTNEWKLRLPNVRSNHTGFTADGRFSWSMNETQVQFWPLDPFAYAAANPVRAFTSAEEEFYEIGDRETRRRRAAAAAQELPSAWQAYRLGLAAFDRGDLETAAKCFERAVYLRPRYWLGYFGRAAVHAAEGRLEPALDELRAAVANGHDSPRNLLHDVRLGALQGDPRLAAIVEGH